MNAARTFWEAIDRRKRERDMALAGVTDDEMDDHEDQVGDELADREGA